MSVIIPSLVHAACKVALAPDPVLVTAIGVKSVVRTSEGSHGLFDVALEQPIDPKTALLFATMNLKSSEPLGGIDAFMDDDKPSIIHVVTSQDVIASANVSADGNTTFGSGFQGITHPSTGEYDFQLSRALTVQGSLFKDATILVTPGAAGIAPSWSVVDATHFKVLLADTSAAAKDAAFSIALVPNDAGPHGFDVSFSLLISDLSSTGAIPATTTT